MPTRNFDSSLLTKRKQAKANATFSTAVDAGVTAGTTVRHLQSTNQSAELVTEKNLGKCYCTTDATANPYEFNPSGGSCGCGLGR